MNDNLSVADRELLKLRGRAAELIRVIDLEVSGIRDGDGVWIGSDALDALLGDVALQIAFVSRQLYGPTDSLPCEPSSDEIPF